MLRLLPRRGGEMGVYGGKYGQEVLGHAVVVGGVPFDLGINGVGELFGAGGRDDGVG